MKTQYELADHTTPIVAHPGVRCGTIVSVRPCSDNPENKTFTGILIGDVATSISVMPEHNGVTEIAFSLFNPAILVPALGRIVFGYESWWRVDKTAQPITDENIQVQMEKLCGIIKATEGDANEQA